MPQPSLTVRALAELLEAPLYEYDRILLEQKYSDQGPATYKIPYYTSALAAIRRYFKQGRSDDIITNAISDIETHVGKQKHRIENNVRALESFRKYRTHRSRRISPNARESAEAEPRPSLSWRNRERRTRGNPHQY